MRYKRGKADWILRRMPSDPPPPLSECLSALPFFINNLVPALRDSWIRISGRAAVKDLMKDDVARIGPNDPIPPTAAPGAVKAVVLNSDAVVLGAIEANAPAARAADAMNPAPQTIRPDMTHALAAALLRKHPYLLVTDCGGKYLGRYALLNPSQV